MYRLWELKIRPIRTKIHMVANCEKGNNCLHTCQPKLCEWHFHPMDTQDLSCIKVVPPEELLQDLHHQILRKVKKDQWMLRESACGDIFLSYLSLTLRVPTFLLFLSILLTSVCLQLNAGRGISYNSIITNPTKYLGGGFHSDLYCRLSLILFSGIQY